MFSRIKHFYAQSVIFIFSSLALVSCGPAGNIADANKEIPMPHDEMIKNFADYAVACYAPVIANDTVNCRLVSRYAHYTMAFMDMDVLDGKNVKVQYKLRYGEKDGLSCVEHQTVDPEKINIFEAKDNIGDVSQDNEIMDSPTSLALKDKIVAREKPIGQLCYKYTLITTDNPKMTYQIKSEEFKDAKPTGKTEMLAIFSNGTKVRVVK